MNHRGVAFYSIVILALVLMALIVVTQLFTNKSTSALTTGNLKAVETFRLNNSIQGLVNLSFELESKFKTLNIKIDKQRLQPLKDSLIYLGYNANVLVTYTSAESPKTSQAINNAIDSQINLSEKILHAIQNNNQARLNTLTDSLRTLNLGDVVYDKCITLQASLQENFQQTLNKNSEQADKLSLFNRILAVVSIIAISALTTIIIRRQSLQLKLIEELKAAELAALKSRNAKDEFLANMSHELRTPLNALIGFGNLLSETELNQNQKEYVGIIRSSGHNLLNIVNDVLDLSKIEAGKLTIAHKLFNLQDLLARIKKLFSASIQEKGLRYDYFIDEQIPNNLIGDPDRLQQILVNLISNAIKFTNFGGIDISAGIVWTDEDERYYKLSFTIKDTGVGIPREKIETIFERFEQLEQGAQRSHGGTGLGLTIVKNLVEKMGGSISVYSHINEGSEFNFTCILEKAGEHEGVSGKAITQKISFRNARVLVVEDNKTNQTLLKHIFRKYDLEPLMISNGQEAIDILKHTTFDLVFMDIQMPIVDGYTAINILRNKLKLKTDVIAMTAYVSENEVKKCLKAGFSDYMAKPIDEKTLIQKTKAYLKHVSVDEVESEKGIDNQLKGSDLVHLKTLVGDDPDVINDIVQEMLSQWEKDKADIIASAQANDIDKLNRSLHRFKSTFSSLGPDHEVYRLVLDMSGTLNDEVNIFEAKCIAFVSSVDNAVNNTLQNGVRI